MKTIKSLAWLGLLFSLLSSLSFADFLRVTRKADVYEGPTKKSAVVCAVEEGAQLQIYPDDASNRKAGYYHVSNPVTGQAGWIYKTYVRRCEGTAEGATVEAPAAAEEKISAETAQPNRHLKVGKPEALYERFREGYALAQDARLKIPVWVQYEISPGDLSGGVERTNAFAPDTSIPYGSRAELSDYAGSGYDRGHQAPAADMSRSDKVMAESFLLSNMAPQVGVGFNQGIWKDLEEAVRGWVEQKGTLTVITGPAFAVADKKVSYPVIGKDSVAVPTHFFKIVIDAKNQNDVEALAFLLPNKDLRGHAYGEYLVSIDEIEQMTGLDFLSSLPKDVQDKVESKKAERIW